MSEILITAEPVKVGSFQHRRILEMLVPKGVTRRALIEEVIPYLSPAYLLHVEILSRQENCH